MSRETLDYQSPLTHRGGAGRGYLNRKAVARAVWIVVGVVVVVNVGLVMAAAGDGSWGALAIMTMIGPATNGALFLASLGFIPVVRQFAGCASIDAYVLTGTLLPIVAIVVDGAWILSMDLHGC